jgi:microcystin-dependent protein
VLIFILFWCGFFNLLKGVGMDPILGQIILWPVPWVPEGWALCDGSIIQISQNQALYSLIGNHYGGTAGQTFALPDLRFKVPMGSQTVQTIGATGGNSTVTVNATGTGLANISVNNLPAHNHGATFTPGAAGSATVSIPADGATGSTNVPSTSTILAQGMVGATSHANIYSTNAGGTTLKPFNITLPTATGTVSTSNTGLGQALPINVTVPVTVSTIQPYLTFNFIIATSGIYPVRP